MAVPDIVPRGVLTRSDNCAVLPMNTAFTFEESGGIFKANGTEGRFGDLAERQGQDAIPVAWQCRVHRAGGIDGPPVVGEADTVRVCVNREPGGLPGFEQRRERR